MRLYIVRHGEAQRQAATDPERALTQQGRDQVRSLWASLRDEGVMVTRLISSPYVRARQTADEIAALYADTVREEQECLIPEAAPARVLSWLLEQPQTASLVLVSHMPLVGQLTGMLVESGAARVPFSVATVACLDVDVAAPAGARLLWLRAPETPPTAV